MSDVKPKTSPPEQVIFPTPMTARDLLLVGVKNDVNILANAISAKPGDEFTLNINIAIRFKQEDVATILREAGYDVKYHDGRSA